MPSIPLRIPSPSRALSTPSNPLPKILHTPSGLAIIEIQGTLHFPWTADAHSAEPSSVDSTRIGKLVFPLLEKQDSQEEVDGDAWMKRVYLYIGQHQRMAGEVKKLTKPLAVIRKKSGNDATDEELEMVEIITYKLVFSQRPEPVGVEE